MKAYLHGSQDSDRTAADVLDAALQGEELELEALKRAYASDLTNWDTYLALVGAELRRRFSQQAESLWLVSVIRSLYQDMMKLDVECDWGDDGGYEAWEIWDRTQVDLLTFYNSDWGGDSLTVLDFGSCGMFVAFDTNPNRDLNDYETVEEIDLHDTGAVRGVVRSYLWEGLSLGDHLGRCPVRISFEDPVTGSDIRSVTVDLFVGYASVAEECSEWMTDNGHGDWPTEFEHQRVALADAYLEIVLGYSVEDYTAELNPDEGGGVLLSELLETTQTDLVRIEAELGRLRSDLGDEGELQM
jgi:hypothetical protein